MTRSLMSITHILRQLWYVALGMISAYFAHYAPVWWQRVIKGMVFVAVFYLVGEVVFCLAGKIKRHKTSGQRLELD